MGHEPTETESLPPEEIESDNNPVKPFLDHLEDLRWTLIKIGAAVAIATSLCFVLAPQLLAIIIYPLKRVTTDPKPFLRTLEVTGGFTMALQLSIYSGFLLAGPWVLYFLAQFILPALTRKEKGMMTPVFVAGALLFLAGVAMAYFLVLPITLQFFIGYNERFGISSEWTIQSYVSFVSMIMLAFGLCFEMPLVIVVLAKLGIVNSEFLRQKRPLVITILFILAAVLTPPDVISQVMLAVPMCVLYEGCIWIAWWMERKRQKSEASSQ